MMLTSLSGSLMVLFMIHAASSISLTLLNKSIAMTLPLPFHVLILQNSSAVLLTLICAQLNLLDVKPLKLDHLRRMLPLSLMYVAVLWTSLVGLARVSVTTVVIGRSLIPLGTAIFERFTTAARFATEAYAALFLIFFGSAVYALSEKQPDMEGIGFVLLNVVLCIVLPVLEKRFVQDMKAEQTAPGLVAYRNITSLPVLVAFVALTSGLSGFARVADLTSRELSILGVSCLFSFSIGVAVFYLQSRVTATTIVTANNWYKLLTLLASLFIWSVPFERLGWIGISINFAGLFWYSYMQAESSSSSTAGQKSASLLPSTSSTSSPSTIVNLASHSEPASAMGSGSTPAKMV